MNRDITPLLGALDPAPRRALTPAEQARSEQLLSSVLTVVVKRRRPVRRIAVAVGVAAAVVVAPVAYHLATGVSGPLSNSAIASWTSVPVKLAASTTDSTAQQWCEQHATGDPKATGPFTVSNADLRGEVTSLVLTRGSDITLCLVGSDNAGLTEAIDPVGRIAANEINLDSAGGHGDGPSGFDYMEGSAGANVKSITLHDGDRTVEALVDGGRWTAWWPANPPTGDISGDVTITLTDGTTRSVSGQSLFQH